MCRCLQVFNKAREMKITHKGMKKVATLNAFFKPLANNEFRCKGCGKVHKKDW